MNRLEYTSLRYKQLFYAILVNSCTLEVLYGTCVHMSREDIYDACVILFNRLHLRSWYVSMQSEKRSVLPTMLSLFAEHLKK